MAYPTRQDSLTSLQPRAESSSAQATLSLNFTPDVRYMATRPERSLPPFNARLSAPTIGHQPTMSSVSDTEDEFLLDNYHIQERLCFGVEGQIFLSCKASDGEQTILKVYHSGITPSDAVLTRINQSPQANIVNLLDYGRIGYNGQFYEVQTPVLGGSLTEILASGRPLDEATCLQILDQLMQALKHLHTPDEKGFCLVHRDIKPDNILYETTNGLPRFVLCDFGIARVVHHENPLLQKETRCTPRYAAPEVFAGEISTKGDFWSLGMLLLEAATGRHPFDGLSDTSIEELLCRNWEPDLATLYTPRWNDLLSGLLKFSPAERWGQNEVKAWLTGEQEVENELDTQKPDHEFLEFAHLRANTPEGLAARLAYSWQQASALLDDSLFQRWLALQLTRVSPGKTLEDVLDTDGTASDIRLLRLIYRIYPSLPVGWKTWSLERSHLADICRQAYHGDTLRRELIIELHTLNILNELAVLTKNDDLKARAKFWNNAVDEYSKVRARLEKNGAPESLFHTRKKQLPRLYLLASEGEEGLQGADDAISMKQLICYPWLEIVQQFQRPYSVVERHIKTMALSFCHADHRRMVTVTHGPNATAERSTGTQAWQFGWNPPTIHIVGEHLDYTMTIGQSQTTVAKGVRLRWSVRRAGIIYLTHFGLQKEDGCRPEAVQAAGSFFQILVGLVDGISHVVRFLVDNLRRLVGLARVDYEGESERVPGEATYTTVNECRCSHHDESWFTLGETTVFSLVAIGSGGICVHRLPQIVVPQPQLALHATFSGTVLMGENLYATEPFTNPPLGKEDLFPQLHHSAKTLGRTDLYLQEQFNRPVV